MPKRDDDPSAAELLAHETQRMGWPVERQLALVLEFVDEIIDKGLIVSDQFRLYVYDRADEDESGYDRFNRSARS